MSNPAYGLGFHAFFGAMLSGRDVSSSNDLVPDVFPVSIDGNPYILDTNNPSGGNLFRRDSIALLRTQADSARSAGESSVSPEIFWRRSFDSWHLGAGQTHADREASSPYRFRSSKGLDPWTQGQISTLNDTALISTSDIAANSNVRCVVAGSRLYVASGQTVKYTTSTSGTFTWTTVTGTPAETVAGIESDGLNVWIAYPSAVYSTTTAGSSASSLSTAPTSQSWTGVFFNKNKLFAAANDSKIYEISSAGTKTAIVDRSALGFTWTAATGVGGYHYLGGYNGDKSVIYKVTLTAEGTALGAGTVAGELPDGEKLYHLGSYLGFLLAGTSKGLRFCTIDGDGYITLGGLIQTNQPVYATEGQDRFVWFSWGYYDSLSSGLGRLDLANFTSTSTPAYASDLMATGTSASPVQGDVLSVVTWGNYRVFTVAGYGLVRETTDTAVTSATISSGLVSYGIIDTKVAAFIETRMSGLASGSSIAVKVQIDGDAGTTVGTVTEAGAVFSGEFYIGKSGRNFEVTLTMTNAVTCTGVLFRSYPAPKRSTKFTVPIMLFDTVSAGGTDWFGNPEEEYAYLEELHSNQLPITYKEGNLAYTVVMDDYAWLPEKKSSVAGWQGTFVAVFREIL